MCGFMHWIAPAKKDSANGTLEKRLRAAADQRWACAVLKQSEYTDPVRRRANLEKTDASSVGTDQHSGELSDA
jgi:hypothetical protein